MQENTCSIKAEWTSYTQSAESHYLEDTTSVESGKEDMEDVLHKWLASFIYRCYLPSDVSTICILLYVNWISSDLICGTGT